MPTAWQTRPQTPSLQCSRLPSRQPQFVSPFCGAGNTISLGASPQTGAWDLSWDGFLVPGGKGRPERRAQERKGQQGSASAENLPATAPDPGPRDACFTFLPSEILSPWFKSHPPAWGQHPSPGTPFQLSTSFAKMPKGRERTRERPCSLRKEPHGDRMLRSHP